MARLDPRVNLEMYTREAIRNADVWTDSMVRREYSRLRDIAQKRLERLGRNEPESYAYRANKGQYAPARGQETEALRQQLPQLAKFIAAKTGSVTGIRAQRKKAVESLQSKGYAFVTQENIRAFGEFMEDFRARKGAARSYGTFDALELWEFAQEHEIDVSKVKQQFAQWLKERRELEKYVRKRSKAGEETTADDILQEFNRLEKERKKERRGLRPGD